MSSNTDFLDVIREVGSQQTIAAGTQLFRQDDPIRDIYLLEKGLVKFLYIEMNGQEMITEIRSAGSILGAASAVANQPAPTTVVAVTPCEVYCIAIKDFQNMEKTNQVFSHELLEFICRQRNEQNIRYAQLGTLSARARLGRLLLQFMDDFGVERNGQRQLALPLSKQDIAGLLAITPQRLSVLIFDLKKAGLIMENNGWIICKDTQRLIYELGEGRD